MRWVESSNSQLNDNLEQQAKLLYDYWFVQFEFPNEDGKPYKSSGGKMVYNKQLKREIPEGWEVKELGEIAELVRGVTYNKDDIKSFKNDLTIAILRATNISENKIDLNNPVFVNKKLVSDKQILNQFDILMTMSSGSIDHVGKNGLYMFQEQVSFGAFCIKIAPNVDYHYYTYLFLQSPFINTTIRNECLGTNINNLNGTIVKSFKVINPKKSILEKFNCVTNPLFYNISINIQQNQQLSSLRDWLLPMLMNGQVKVE